MTFDVFACPTHGSRVQDLNAQSHLAREPRSWRRTARAQLEGSLPVYFVKREVDFGSRLRANENDTDEKLYGSLEQRDERSVMA